VLVVSKPGVRLRRRRKFDIFVGSQFSESWRALVGSGISVAVAVAELSPNHIRGNANRTACDHADHAELLRSINLTRRYVIGLHGYHAMRGCRCCMFQTVQRRCFHS
jgi:hypothetical protein